MDLLYTQIKKQGYCEWTAAASSSGGWVQVMLFRHMVEKLNLKQSKRASKQTNCSKQTWLATVTMKPQ